jgi:succinate-acetate transporter protein
MSERSLETPEVHYDKWKWQAPLGLTAVGLGASLLGHASNMKAKEVATWKWVVAGTASLVVLNAGLSLFGDAVKHRTLYEWTDAARNDSARS